MVACTNVFGDSEMLSVGLLFPCSTIFDQILAETFLLKILVYRSVVEQAYNDNALFLAMHSCLSLKTHLLLLNIFSSTLVFNIRRVFNKVV